MGFQITGVPEADAVLNEHPLAVVIGMQLDQQYKVEDAFKGGWKILSRFGTLDAGAIAAADPDEFRDMCATAPAIHRFPKMMAPRVQGLAALVESTYDGDVTRLWTEAKDGADLLKRFKDVPGVGDQTARILVALVAKQLGVRPPGWEKAAGAYAREGYRSAADIVDADSAVKVREFKQQRKAAATAADT
jgi:uncharacterized HhH-GPD family protein